jgi:uncharacterized protein (DUF58 family)
MPRYGLSPLGRGLFSLVLPCLILGSMAGQHLVLGIGISVGLLMVVGYIWSALVVRTVGVSAASAGDVTLGSTVEVLVTVSGPKGLECAIQVMGGESLGVRIPTAGIVSVLANEMGCFEQIPMTVQTGIPDGVVGAVEHRTALLAEPLYVYPAPVHCEFPTAPGTTGSVSSDQGELTGLREYTPGDKLRDVHWPALARTGAVLVRDHRAPTSKGRITVALAYTTAPNLELVAGRARYAIQTLIQRGHQVDLLIGQQLEPVTAEVQALRRLACLKPETPPLPETITGPILTIDAKRGTTWVTQI